MCRVGLLFRAAEDILRMFELAIGVDGRLLRLSQARRRGLGRGFPPLGFLSGRGGLLGRSGVREVRNGPRLLGRAPCNGGTEQGCQIVVVLLVVDVNQLTRAEQFRKVVRRDD